MILARSRDEVAVNPRRDRFGVFVRVGFMKEAVGVEEGRLHADRVHASGARSDLGGWLPLSFSSE